MNETELFVYSLKKYRQTLTKQQISTIKGQALSGDLEGAKKGLTKLLELERNREVRRIAMDSYDKVQACLHCPKKKCDSCFSKQHKKRSEQ